MRVTGDHRRDAGSLRIQVEPLYVVEHVDVAAAELYDLGGR
jgi:hypothetical protein